MKDKEVVLWLRKWDEVQALYYENQGYVVDKVERIGKAYQPFKVTLVKIAN